MNFTIESPKIYYTISYEQASILKNEIIKKLAENKISIEDSLVLFNDILYELTGNMPITMDRIKN